VARRLAPALAVFAGAALIFLAEPLAAKLVLPRLGGGPSVWTGCMLFFQALLLAGYGYAHLLGTRSSRRVQVVVHAVVLAAGLAVLPIALPRGLGDPGGWPPLAWLAAALGGALALPFAALAGTGLLLQRWYEGDDPYPLYAASGTTHRNGTEVTSVVMCWVAPRTRLEGTNARTSQRRRWLHAMRGAEGGGEVVFRWAVAP